ncbi:MAG: hydrogenase maturation nickel metallochaperone HypA [Chitinophagaceae bacterium]|nr:hydrogenase maturation nickel metallochaperone HypA [Chitinophagaceae bacterium]
MHELSIAYSILSIAENAAPGNDKSVVSAINIQIGALSGIETEALAFAFSVIRDDTLLKDAELNIEIIPGEAICNECHTIFPFHEYGNCCPKCNSNVLQIIKGKELKVLSITVDE